MTYILIFIFICLVLHDKKEFQICKGMLLIAV